MEKPRIGVYVCWCGTNIAMMVDVKEVAEEMKKLPNVVVSKSYKYMCSDPGQELIMQDIKEKKLNRIVVAACSPRIHENTFRKAIEKAGINPYMLEMANIREQNSWVHSDRIKATAKAKSLVTASIQRVGHHSPLVKRQVPVNSATLVIGGGISGLMAALELADSGKEVFLVEKENELGGMAVKIELSFPYMYSIKDSLGSIIQRVEAHEKIAVFKNASVVEINGYTGNFSGTIKTADKQNRSLEFGNIIVATGLRPVNAEKVKNYGYSRFPEVITAFEFEQILKKGNIVKADNTKPKNIAIIHCVGSRNDDFKPYCSRTCCMTGLKYANLLKAAIPGSNIFELYADMRSYGKGCEELYSKTARKNVMFMMFDQRKGLPVIEKDAIGPGVIVRFNEKLSGEDVDVPADLVILLMAMESQEDAKTVAHLTGVSLDSNGFFIEKHPKLDPVATTTDGVYVVGNCQSPKNIPESIAQAKAATTRILSTISKGYVEVEVMTAEVNEDLCCGCQFCIQVCPYGANSFDSQKNVSIVNEAVCKGCGTCASACPSGAITTKHFTDKQIFSQIEGLLSEIITVEETVN